MMTQTLFDRYWRLRMDSAHRRLEAALDLIPHKPTRGAMAENVVREVLESFLPRRWASASGFVVGQDKTSSRQLDILLFDQMNNAPIYRDDQIVVLVEGGAPVGTEVKSNLNKSDLFEALDNVASLKLVDPSATACVFAYRGMTASTLQIHLKTWIRTQKRKKAFSSAVLPEMLCIMEQSVVCRRAFVGESHNFEIYRSVDPVIWSLLASILNNLHVATLTPLLSEPKMAGLLHKL